MLPKEMQTTEFDVWHRYICSNRSFPKKSFMAHFDELEKAPHIVLAISDWHIKTFFAVSQSQSNQIEI